MSNIRIPFKEVIDFQGVQPFIVSLIEPILENLYYKDSILLGDYSDGYYFLKLNIDEVAFIELPFIDDFGLVIGDGDIFLNTFFTPDGYVAYLKIEFLRIRLPHKWIKPVLINSQGDFEIDESSFFEVVIPFGLTIEDELKINISNPASTDLTSLNFPYFTIGNTGLVVQALNIQLDLSDSENIEPANIDGRSNSFKGVYVDQAEIFLPLELKRLPNQETIKIISNNLLVGSQGGVSGTIGLSDPNDDLQVKIGNWKVTLNSFDLTFKQNVIVDSNIIGQVLIPKMKDLSGENAEINVSFHLNEAGDFNLTASEPEGIPFTLFNFVTFNFLTLELGREDDNFYLGTSCQIWFNNAIMTKLLGDQIIEIPRLRVYDNGTIEIVGGNGFIPTNISLNLGPIDIAVKGIHYGATQQEHNGVMRKYNYWGFDGAISLDPLGIDARGEGVKYYYTTDNDDHGGQGHDFLRVQTIEVDLIIPGTATPESALAIIHGMLSIPEPGDSLEYKGAVSVELPKARISGGAAMKLQPRYPAFLIEAGFDIPTPIPLGATGLGFYGFGGLLGYRYVADKAAIPELDPDASWYDYFTYPQRGVNIDKFRVPEETENATHPFSIGAGTVMATMFDDGHLFSTRLMAILSLPSVFILDGRANVLGKRLKILDYTEPPFFAFVAIGNSSIEFGFGADYQLPKDNGWIIDLYAEAQAGFFFDNASAWYINFGTKTNPITATVFKSVLNLRAQSFLMLSASGMEAGARVEFDLRKRFGPAKVHIYAYLEIGGYVSFERPQIGGYIAAGGGIDIDIWIVGVSISLDALFSAEAPKPFLIYAEISLRVCVKILFAKICKRFTIKLKWETNSTVLRDPIPPLPFQTTNIKIDRTEDLVKGIHMLTNDIFDLDFLGMNNAPSNPNSINKIIPLDTYIEFKTEKGLIPGSVSGKIGGYTFPPENHIELIPPQKVVRGGLELRQVKHKYSIESIEVKAWNGSTWKDYHPFQAVMKSDDPVELQNLREEVADLKIGYWQIKGKQYDTIRLLATTPFTYMEAGQPGWSVPEQYGITPSTLYCSEEIRTKECADVLNKSLGTKYYIPIGFNAHFINGAYFTLSGENGYVIINGVPVPFNDSFMEVTNPDNVFNFSKSLSFNNNDSMEILLESASVLVELMLTTSTNGLNIYYYKSIQSDLTSTVEYELITSVYKTSQELNQIVVYEDEDNPVIKIVIEPDVPTLQTVLDIQEQIQGLFEATYDKASGNVIISEPEDTTLYNQLIQQLKDFRILNDDGDPNCEKDMEVCAIYDSLLKMFNDCYLPVETSSDVDDNIACFKEFEGIIKNFIQVYLQEPHPIITEYEKHVLKLKDIIGLQGHHEQILRFRDLKLFAETLLELIYDFGDCDCGGSIEDLCDLYDQLYKRYLDCMPYPVNSVPDIIDEQDCFNEFLTLLENFDSNNPQYNLLQQLGEIYTNLVDKLSTLNQLLDYYPGGASDTFIINLYYDFRECVMMVLDFINNLGNCDPNPTDKFLTHLHQVCWLTIEDHEYNITIPGSDAIEAEYQTMIEAIARTAQPIWRPNTAYYVKYRLKDEVDNGNSSPGEYDYYYGFKTVGPLGHYHKNPEVDYVPSGANADEFPLTSLRSYIDYERSYPNANGNLLQAKPLFYGHKQCKIGLHFIKPLTYHMLNKWYSYNGMPNIDGVMHIAIKDPITDVIIPYPLPIDYEDDSVPEITNPNEWVDTDDPRIPPHIQVINNMIENGELPCEIDLGDPIVPNSQNLSVILTNLKPRKLYTVLLYNAFEVNEGNIVSEPIHEFVFQTSRYTDFKSQVESYLYQDEFINTNQAVFAVDLPLDNPSINKAYDIVANPLSQVGDYPLENQYQHLFDRVIEGVLGITPIDPPTFTEFNKVINTNTGKLIGLWIRNPEPFNNPKIPLEEVDGMIQVLFGNGNPNGAYKVLYSKDYAQAFIMHTSREITALELSFKFKYFEWNGSEYISDPINDVDVLNIEINK